MERKFPDPIVNLGIGIICCDIDIVGGVDFGRLRLDAGIDQSGGSIQVFFSSSSYFWSVSLGVLDHS